MKRSKQRGNAAVETAIIAIPMAFVALGGIELARCMWMYHTLAAATKSAVRYAIVHGDACIAANPNCAATVGSVAGVLRRSSVGIEGSGLRLSFIAGTQETVCASLPSCEANAEQWPPSSHNVAGQNITIRAGYQFRSVLRGFWPGQNNGVVPLKAQATEAIQF